MQKSRIIAPGGLGTSKTLTKASVADKNSTKGAEQPAENASNDEGGKADNGGKLKKGST